MDITDCVGYFGYLKVNGYLEDVHLKKTFNSVKQRQNIDFILDLQKKSKYQIERIFTKDDNIIDTSDLEQISIESDDDYILNDNYNQQISQNDESDLQNEEIEKKSKKIIKMPKNKYNHYKDFKLVVDKALKYILHGKKIAWISQTLNIPYTTLRDWKNRYLIEKSYRPYRRYRKTKNITKEDDEKIFQKVKTEMKRKRYNFLNYLEILNDFFFDFCFS